jgi:hypothetical protein
MSAEIKEGRFPNRRSLLDPAVIDRRYSDDRTQLKARR